MPAEVKLAVAADDGGANVPVYPAGTSPAAGELKGIGYLAGTKQLVFGHDNDITNYGATVGARRVWLDPDNGSDSTGQYQREDKPFKTFTAAYNAAQARDSIMCKRGVNALNGTEAAITIDKSIFVFSDRPHYNQVGSGFVNCKITVTVDAVIDNYGVCFFGMSFLNTSLDDICVVITESNSHQILFEKCYFARTTGTKIALQTTGAWPVKTTGAQPAIVRITDAALVGKMNFSHGTVGAPLDRLGIIEIYEVYPLSWVAYGSEVVINSGAVRIRSTQTPCITLNGGAAIIESPQWLDLMTGSVAINAPAATAGHSLLHVTGVDQSAFYGTFTGTQPKINIGANVIYHVDGVLDPASLTIDAAAVKLRNYMVSLGKNAPVSYDSSSSA